MSNRLELNDLLLINRLTAIDSLNSLIGEYQQDSAMSNSRDKLRRNQVLMLKQEVDSCHLSLDISNKRLKRKSLYLYGLIIMDFLLTVKLILK